MKTKRPSVSARKKVGAHSGISANAKRADHRASTQLNKGAAEKRVAGEAGAGAASGSGLRGAHHSLSAGASIPIASLPSDSGGHASDAATISFVGATGHRSGQGAHASGAEQAPTFAQELAGKVFTRRNFLIGAGALLAAGAVGGGVTLSKRASEQAERAAVAQVAGDAVGSSTVTGGLPLLNVPEDAVFTTENCEYVDDTESILRLHTKATLPYGTLLWASDDNVAACLLPTESSTPLTQIGLLSLSSGNLATVVKEPIGLSENFQIFDVRANGTGLIWTESDILTGKWRVYTAGVSNLMAGTPVLAAEGDGMWELPSLAICGGYGFWQMVPLRSAMEDVPSSQIRSSLMRIPIGASADSAEQIYDAKGYMACAPANSATGIAFAPRSEASGTYYQLTHIDAETGEVTDQLTLPASMKPSEVGYGSTGFSFAFDGIYSYGGGIANLGTYTPSSPVSLDTRQADLNAIAAIEDEQPVDKDGARKPLDEQQMEQASKRAVEAVADLYSASEWFRFPRSPLTVPAWCGNWFIVKSTNVVAGVDMASRRYFTLSAEGNGESYGEFLASSGTTGKLVTYANLDYTPISGSAVKECAVRVWNVNS